MLKISKYSFKICNNLLPPYNCTFTQASQTRKILTYKRIASKLGQEYLILENKTFNQVKYF